LRYDQRASTTPLRHPTVNAMTNTSIEAMIPASRIGVVGSFWVPIVTS
jgi:hypothetical protein